MSECLRKALLGQVVQLRLPPWGAVRLEERGEDTDTDTVQRGKSALGIQRNKGQAEAEIRYKWGQEGVEDAGVLEKGVLSQVVQLLLPPWGALSDEKSRGRHRHRHIRKGASQD